MQLLDCSPLLKPSERRVILQIPRAAGAILLAPLVDRGLTWVERKLHLKSKRQAFLLVTLAGIGMTALVFGTVFLFTALL